MGESRVRWRSTTHDWARDVDVDHLALIRKNPAAFAPGGLQHLILEVVAYAADEAEYNNGGGAQLPSALTARCRSRMMGEAPPPVSTRTASR
jgi:topoisomerase IV subunit B